MPGTGCRPAVQRHFASLSGPVWCPQWSSRTATSAPRGTSTAPADLTADRLALGQRGHLQPPAIRPRSGAGRGWPRSSGALLVREWPPCRRCHPRRHRRTMPSRGRAGGCRAAARRATRRTSDRVQVARPCTRPTRRCSRSSAAQSWRRRAPRPRACEATPPARCGGFAGKATSRPRCPGAVGTCTTRMRGWPSHRRAGVADHPWSQHRPHHFSCSPRPTGSFRRLLSLVTAHSYRSFPIPTCQTVSDPAAARRRATAPAARSRTHRTPPRIVQSARLPRPADTPPQPARDHQQAAATYPPSASHPGARGGTCRAGAGRLAALKPGRRKVGQTPSILASGARPRTPGRRS